MNQRGTHIWAALHDPDHWLGDTTDIGDGSRPDRCRPAATQRTVSQIRSGAMVETRTIQQSVATVAQTLSIPAEQIVAQFTEGTLLKRSPTPADTARLAAFLVSDRAPTLTGTIVNSTSGMRID